MKKQGCNVRNLPYMPLFIDRLLNSDTWIMASGDEAKAMITIWCAAWHQNEAGTLPNNDEVLKVLSRAGENWMQMRETVLSGFELNEKTNRLHHQVIQEIAAEAFGKTDRFRKAANARWNKKQLNNATNMERINNASTNGAATHMQRIDEKRREENRIEHIPPLPPAEDEEESKQVEESVVSQPENLESQWSESLGTWVVPSPADQLRRQRAAEVTPPNLLLDREKIISTIQAFHINRANAEVLHNGARKQLQRQELVDLIQYCTLKGCDRDELKAKIVEACAVKEREATQMMHSDVGVENLRYWGKVSQRLRAEKGESYWRSVVKSICLDDVGAGSLTLRAPPGIQKEIKAKLHDRIIKLWSDETGKPTELKVIGQ